MQSRACLKYVCSATGRSLWQKPISLSESASCPSVCRGQRGRINHMWFGLKSLHCGLALGAPQQETLQDTGSLFTLLHTTAWAFHLSRGRDTENYTIKNGAVNQQTGLEMANRGNSEPSCSAVGLCRNQELWNLTFRKWSSQRYCLQMSQRNPDRVSDWVIADVSVC